MFRYAQFAKPHIILCLFWVQIQIAKSKPDDLQFWSRDPKFWAGVYPARKSAGTVGPLVTAPTEKAYVTKNVTQQVEVLENIAENSAEERARERRQRYQEDRRNTNDNDLHMNHEDHSTDHSHAVHHVPHKAILKLSRKRDENQQLSNEESGLDFDSESSDCESAIEHTDLRSNDQGPINNVEKLSNHIRSPLNKLNNHERGYKRLKQSIKTTTVKEATTQNNHEKKGSSGKIDHHGFNKLMRQDQQIPVYQQLIKQLNITLENKTKETKPPKKHKKDKHHQKKEKHEMKHTETKNLHFKSLFENSMKKPKHINKRHKKIEPEILSLVDAKHKSVTKGLRTDDSNEDNYAESASSKGDDQESVPAKFVHHKKVKWPERTGHHHRGKLRQSSHLKKEELLEIKKLHPFSIARQFEHLTEKLQNNASIEQEIIGRTIEYNDIVLWKISEMDEYSRKRNKKKVYAFGRNAPKYADDKAEKKIVFIVHGLVVMGWHSLKCLSHFDKFQKLVGYYIDNLDTFDIYLVPMANPDGVAMAETHPLWNKNAAPQKGCPGVNVDRNFDVAWNEKMTKESSCNTNFPGLRAFSEHESKAVKSVFARYGHKMVAYFHVHAGTFTSEVFKGEAVLYPKGYTDVQSDDDKYIDLKGEIDEAMRNSSFKAMSVTVDTLHSWYGTVYGTSVDYASTIYGIPYCLELVMQIYQNDEMVSDEDEREQNTALTEIWQNVIDVIFDTIYKTVVKPNE